MGATTVDLAAHYRAGRERTTELVAGLDDAGWATPVAACPGWDVRAVVSHLVGIQEDVAAGTLAGVPTEEQTADQVARHRDTPPADLLARWAELSPDFEALITQLQVWPAAIDVGTHEQDIRTTLGRPGARDCPLIVEASHVMAEQLDAGVPVAFDLDGTTLRSQGPGEPALRLRTSAFELFRARLGRRSRDQVAALDWSADPAPVLGALFVFGPRPDPLVE